MQTIRLLVFLLILMHAGSYADLKWDATMKKVEVHPLQASISVDFSFTNSGNEPVNIKDLKPSCSCISGHMKKMEYAPGESGIVTVSLNLQGRVGAQLKGLTVITDDPSSRRIKLHINTSVPETYSSSEKRVVWSVDDKKIQKSIMLTNKSKTSFPLEKAVAAKEDISIELKPVRDGFEYELILSPSDNVGKGIIPITIYPVKPDGVEAVKTFTVYAVVK